LDCNKSCISTSTKSNFALILCGTGQLVGLVLMVPVSTSPSQPRTCHHQPLTVTKSSSQAHHSHAFVNTSPSQSPIHQHKPLTATNSSSHAPHSHEFVIISPSQPRVSHHKFMYPCPSGGGEGPPEASLVIMYPCPRGGGEGPPRTFCLPPPLPLPRIFGGPCEGLVLTNSLL
jgi:hypothetical protein